ncbi:hypothetical protein Patl1_19216 [Pistacia atlantica]|uniref:Uncharacterized protein n=1 Tax=Pistacia atlantica TaxID=434234 RepID=A0ACC1BY67_9ROSI|nr:hypothetical protein Patl1_19216 [Pistacia atlantica]
MEAERTPFCVNIKNYRRRRRYRRLNNVVSDNENVKIAACQKTHQRFGKIQLISRRIRDAYVDMMLHFARHVAKFNNGNNVYLLMKNASDFEHFTD